jgi:hypothetical protein
VREHGRGNIAARQFLHGAHTAPNMIGYNYALTTPHPFHTPDFCVERIRLEFSGELLWLKVRSSD